MDAVDPIIEALGGLNGAATALGIQTQSVRKWKENGVPTRHWPDIVRLSDGAITYDTLEIVRPKPVKQRKRAAPARKPVKAEG